MKSATLASPEGTASYRDRFALLPGNFRPLGDLSVSSLGLGTYLGQETAADDERCRDAALFCLQHGVNLLDTAINYRAQRSERALGEALLHLGRLNLSRDQVVVCTKAGYLPFDGTRPRDAEAYLARTYGDLIPEGQLVSGCHSLAPAYLRDQLKRSLRNLRLQAVDIFYLHNPESQLAEVPRDEFDRRMRDAFALCEELCQQGLVGSYGCATWDGLRAEAAAPEHLSLARLCELAREAGGPGHRFRVVQLPLNLAMTEALSRRNQLVDGAPLTLLEAAARLGVSVICSGPLLQGKILSRSLPERLRKPFVGLQRDSQRALQFVRSAPGVTAALCGMKDQRHLEENLQLLRSPPLLQEVYAQSFREPAG